MSPKVVVCLVLSVMVGMAAFAWALITGWGVLIGIIAYSLTGSLALVMAAVVASLLESAREDDPSALSQHVTTDIR